MHQLLTTDFWFGLVNSEVQHIDKVFLYISVAAVILGIIFMALAMIAKNPSVKKLFRKFDHLGWTTGLCGGVWFLFRYENTPIFALHYWMAIIGIAGLVWLGFIIKYFAVDFFRERAEYARQQVKNKYLPQN